MKSPLYHNACIAALHKLTRSAESREGWPSWRLVGVRDGAPEVRGATFIESSKVFLLMRSSSGYGLEVRSIDTRLVPGGR